LNLIEPALQFSGGAATRENFDEEAFFREPWLSHLVSAGNRDRSRSELSASLPHGEHEPMTGSG